MMKNITRRGFIKSLGLLTLSASLPTWATNSLGKGYEKVKRESQPHPLSKPVNDDYDVIVVGGGPAGCAAAVAASREGAKTLLLESTGVLGGLGTSGLVPAWCPFSDGEKIIYKGLAWKVFEESKKGVSFEPKEKVDWVAINPEYLMRVYDRMLGNSGADLLFFSQMGGVEKSSDGKVDTILVSNKNGITPYRAKIYIDASGDGDLATWAGADYLKGDESGDLQQSTLCFSVANVDIEAYKAGPELHSGHNPNSPSMQAMKTGRYPLLDSHCCSNIIGPGVVGFNANHIAIKDTTNPQMLSDAMLQGREVAEQHLEMLKEYHPVAFKDSFIVKTAILPGVRDSRRIVGDYIFTAEDWYARRTFDDEIGRNCYFIDVHKPGHPEIHYKRGESHGIPYRCLTPAKLTNVLTAGRCISTDSESYGSLRVMPNCLVTGEAAGLAAALASFSLECNVHNIDVNDLRSRLRKHGAYFL